MQTGTAQQGLIRIKQYSAPVLPISNAVALAPLIDKLSKKYPKGVQDIYGKLATVNSYRQIRGDGNCFFRALYFTYLTNLLSTSLEKAFPDLNEISLTNCPTSLLPSKFQQFYNDKFLKEILRYSWQGNYQMYLSLSQNNYRQAMCRMLKENQFLDVIIILYIRAVCLREFKRNRSNIKEMTIGDEEKCIMNFGQEAQGIIFQLCSKLFQMHLTIYEVRSDNILQHQFSCPKPLILTSLLLSQKHYDLLEWNQEVSPKEEDMATGEFYSEIKHTTMNGQCVECMQNKLISMETGLCDQCCRKYLEEITNSKAEVCSQCGNMLSIGARKGQICASCVEKIDKESNHSTQDNSYFWQQKKEELKKQKMRMELEKQLSQGQEKLQRSFLRPVFMPVQKDLSVVFQTNSEYKESKLMSRLVGKDSSQSSEKNSFDRIRIPQIFSNSKEYECSNCQRKFDKSYKAYNEARNLCEDCSDIFTPQIGVQGPSKSVVRSADGNQPASSQVSSDIMQKNKNVLVNCSVCHLQFFLFALKHGRICSECAKKAYSASISRIK